MTLEQNCFKNEDLSEFSCMKKNGPYLLLSWRMFFALCFKVNLGHYVCLSTSQNGIEIIGGALWEGSFCSCRRQKTAKIESFLSFSDFCFHGNHHQTIKQGKLFSWHIKYTGYQLSKTILQVCLALYSPSQINCYFSLAPSKNAAKMTSYGHRTCNWSVDP